MTEIIATWIHDTPEHITIRQLYRLTVQVNVYKFPLF